MLTPYQYAQAPRNSTPFKQGLLLQFALMEFIQFHDCLQAFLKAFKKSQARSSETLLASWRHISGTPKKERFRLPWETNLGYLGKLEQYSYLLRLNDRKETEPLIKLHESSCKAYQRSLEGYKLLDENRRAIGWSEAVESKMLKVSAHSRSLASLLSFISSLFHEDENVLFFLLHHKEEVSRALGDNLLHEILQNKKSMEDHLVKKFSKRGFEELIPTILQKIHE